MSKFADFIQIMSSAFTLTQYIIISILIIVPYIINSIKSSVLEYLDVRYRIENIVIKYNRLYRNKNTLLCGFGLFGNKKMWNDTILPEIRCVIDNCKLYPYIKQKLNTIVYDWNIHKTVILHDLTDNNLDTHSKVDNSIRKSLCKLYSIKLMIPFMKINMKKY